MRGPRPILARIAFGAILVWSAQLYGSPPRTAAIPRDGDRGAMPLAPNPLVSRSKRVIGWSALQFADPRSVNDGDYSTSWGAGRPTPERPAWVSIDVGFNYEETDYGSPGAYRVETSGDSTDGDNGSWRTAVDVLAVSAHGQAHSFDFSGQRWVKIVVTRTPAESPNGVQLSEIDVHDVTVGGRDCWFFLGDSITALAFDRTPAHQPSFATWVHTRHPEYFPVMINGGTGGDKSDEGAAHIDDWLARNPDVHFWAITYGTNDAAGNESETTRFRKNMQSIVSRVRAAGGIPILATIPFASDGQHRNIPKFNRVLDELRAANSLPTGPDLYTWFAAHPDELRGDGVHPNDRGSVSINRLWGEAVEALYVR